MTTHPQKIPSNRPEKTLPLVTNPETITVTTPVANHVMTVVLK